MRKSTVMAMLLLSVSLIACDNQEAVEVAENTEITENIDSNETEVDPVLETEETVSEDAVVEEMEAKEVTAEEPEESATEVVEETPEVPAEETTTQEVEAPVEETKEQKVEAPVEETKEQKVETPVEETKEQKAETPVETPTETKSNQGTTASNVSDLENHPEWTMKRTWTASNGVVLKIRDKYSHWDFENNMAARATYGASEVIIFDGQDLRPGSAFMAAVTEFQYGTGAHEGGAEVFMISPKDLPLVDTPATKQTSAPKTDSWNTYVEAFNPLWKLQSTGNANATGGNLSNYGTGIGLMGGSVSTYLWNLDWTGDCWKLTIRTNPTELQWNSIRNSLRNVSPDGDALYYAFYDEAYGSKAVFSSYDTWVNIGGSQAMSCVSDFQYYYFK